MCYVLSVTRLTDGLNRKRGGYTVIQSVFRDEIAKELLDELRVAAHSRRRMRSGTSLRSVIVP